MDLDQLRIDLECIAQQRALPPGETLADVLQRLDAAATQPDLPGRLEHYLTKRSYLKAIEWLDNPETPHQV